MKGTLEIQAITTVCIVHCLFGKLHSCTTNPQHFRTYGHLTTPKEWRNRRDLIEVFKLNIRELFTKNSNIKRTGAHTLKSRKDAGTERIRYDTIEEFNVDSKAEYSA